MFYEVELQFIMGADTVERIFESEPKDFYDSWYLRNVTYLYAKRIGFNISDEIQKVINSLYESYFLKFKPIKDFEANHFTISATQARNYLKDKNYTELEILVYCSSSGKFALKNLLKSTIDVPPSTM